MGVADGNIAVLVLHFGLAISGFRKFPRVSRVQAFPQGTECTRGGRRTSLARILVEEFDELPIIVLMAPIPCGAGQVPCAEPAMEGGEGSPVEVHRDISLENRLLPGPIHFAAGKRQIIIVRTWID